MLIDIQHDGDDNDDRHDKSNDTDHVIERGGDYDGRRDSRPVEPVRR